jgi:CelD/BcsL family acetyltransferase involved in cellulose biosynthesis
MPLVANRRIVSKWGPLGFSALELPGDPVNFLRDATIDPFCAPRVSLARLARAAVDGLGGGDLLMLTQLRGDATLLELAEIRRLAGLSAPDPSCLHIPLRASSHPHDMLSKHSRADLNNGRNRLRRLGPLEWKHAPDDMSISEAIRIFIELEASGWKGESGTRSASKFMPSRLALLQDLAAGGDGLQVNVHVMFAASAPVAAMYCITVGGVHFLLLTGYDERYRTSSPGHLLIHEVIQWAVARNMREFDFLSTASYFRRWHPTERSMCHVTTRGGSLKGLMLHQAIYLRKRWRNHIKARPTVAAQVSE